jgi:hypothetical protein
MTSFCDDIRTGFQHKDQFESPKMRDFPVPIPENNPPLAQHLAVISLYLVAKELYTASMPEFRTSFLSLSPLATLPSQASHNWTLHTQKKIHIILTTR